MKILQINAVYGVGSTGVIVKDIHELSLKSGIESYVAYSTSKCLPDEIVNGYVIGNSCGKKLHAILSRVNGKQAYFSRIATGKLIKHIATIKPDVVHLHNLHSNYINLNVLLKFLSETNIAVVVTLHDCWFYTGGCFHYTSVGCDNWTKKCGSCPKKKKDTPAFLFDKSAKILKDRIKYFGAIENLTFVGVSEWITNEAKKSRVPATRYVTIHNGVDTKFFVPTESNLRKELGLEGKFIILTVANKWMLDINAETLKTVTDGIDDDSVVLMVGCDGEQKKRLPKNVLAIDYIRDRDKLRQVYSMADVFVNCTREESFSLANVEPQACGTPTVTYCNTGAAETVDNTNSFSVETGDANALLEQIKEIKANGKQRYSTGCIDFVSKRFDKDTNYRKYLDLYGSLI
ncbi:MAG: glycosyltransferase [Clostridia bacterium]|nr:glycosyltransferase [Clostridia bacterium]